MRYDKKIDFMLVDYVYNANGDYTEEVIEQVTEYGSIVNTDFDTMRLVYGEIRQGSITLHLQNHIDFTFNRIVVDGKTYAVDQRINQRVKQAYILSECQ